MTNQHIKVSPRWTVALDVDPKTEKLSVTIFCNDGSSIRTVQSASVGFMDSVAHLTFSSDISIKLEKVQHDLVTIKREIADTMQTIRSNQDTSVIELSKMRLAVLENDLTRIKGMI